MERGELGQVKQEMDRPVMDFYRIHDLLTVVSTAG